MAGGGDNLNNLSNNWAGNNIWPGNNNLWNNPPASLPAANNKGATGPPFPPRFSPRQPPATGVGSADWRATHPAYRLPPRIAPRPLPAANNKGGGGL
jgi:hypothetical protein